MMLVGHLGMSKRFPIVYGSNLVASAAHEDIMIALPAKQGP
jgi:hypothetical protein